MDCSHFAGRNVVIGESEPKWSRLVMEHFGTVFKKNGRISLQNMAGVREMQFWAEHIGTLRCAPRAHFGTCVPLPAGGLAGIATGILELQRNFRAYLSRPLG